MTGRKECRCPQARHQHGTYLAYNADQCRCTECRQAKLHRQQQTRTRHHRARWGAPPPLTPATSTTTRLRALSALGWSLTALAEHLNVTPRAVSFIRSGEWETVRADTLNRVRDLYNQLSMTRPEGHYADMARNYAARVGWLPPLAIDDDALAAMDRGADVDITADITDIAPDALVDEIAVERIMAGTLRIPAYVVKDAPELVEAIRRLHAKGMSDSQIGARISRRRDAVFKIRARNDIGRNQEGAA